MGEALEFRPPRRPSNGIVKRDAERPRQQSVDVAADNDIQPVSRPAQVGDVVCISLDMKPENGYVPESLFDTRGEAVSFVLGWGNYLPGLHELVEGCKVGDVVHKVSIDAGYGSRQEDLLFEVPRHKLDKIVKDRQPLKKHQKVGSTLDLDGGVKVLIKEIRDNGTVVVDANHPLAGTSYACSFRVLDVIPVDHTSIFGFKDNSADKHNRYEVATFALGCFWGAELAFARCRGVVGTRVGYSQGLTDSPTYEEVCEGSTQHRESVLVVFDTTETSYADLMDVAMDRLDQTSSSSSMGLHLLFETPSENRQYEHGFYFHTPQQRKEATTYLKEKGKVGSGVQCIPASTFHLAEEYHQHYLYKGGQSTRKGCRDPIRCFG